MKPSHEFHAEIHWNLKSKSMERDYTRDHYLAIPGKEELHLSSTARFRGNSDYVSPEEMYLASVTSCLMLTYLNLCYRNSLTITSYQDRASATLTRNKDGQYRMERILLRPRITFLRESHNPMDPEALAIRLIHESHQNCFIINSIRTHVEVEPLFVFT